MNEGSIPREAEAANFRLSSASDKFPSSGRTLLDDLLDSPRTIRTTNELLPFLRTSPGNDWAHFGHDCSRLNLIRLKILKLLHCLREWLSKFISSVELFINYIEYMLLQAFRLQGMKG